MPFSTQQANAASRLLAVVKAIHDSVYDLQKARDAALLIGIPQQADFPAPGDLDHLTRQRLQNAVGFADAFKAWLTTPIDLDGNAATPAKAPLDAIVEAIR